MRRQSPSAPTEPVDINILPEEYRPRVLPSYARSMWIAGVGMLVVAVVLLVMGQLNRAQVRDLNASITRAQRELDAARTPQPEVLELQDELAQIVAAIESVQTVYPRAAAERRDWSAILGAILQYDPELIELCEFFQTGDDLTVIGLALTQEDVLQYAGQLDRSGVFERVLVQSMQRVDQPLATPPPIQLVTTPLAPATPSSLLPPAASPTPTAPATAVATLTGTRVFYDEYEIDDFEYKPIAIGEVQHRNFNPQHDRDRATFLGLAGYRYCIRAVPQAPMVHPVLTVSMGRVGDQVRRSDSCQPAHLDPACGCPDGVPEAATMAITIDTPYDQGVWIDLTNEGRFGPDSWYTLQVVVIATAPEATPTSPLWPPALPTPVTATITPVPPFWTPTPTPSLAPGTQTPDPQCADAYEPDDIVGRPIIPGVGQLRTFCPVGDVDRAVFTAKHGHRYRVETLALSPGVDTELGVLLAGQTYVSRDRSPHDFSSMVEVVGVGPNDRSGADAPAFITIINHGVFGPTRFYTLLVTDLGVIDLYEPDDWSGVEIIPSEPQSRVFYPQGDVDKVFFVAKPHTVYHIYTSDLAPGVDTVLTMDMPRRIVNDNARPGVLYSSIEFANTSSEPVRVDVTITNKGQFGPDKRYTITMAEMGAGDPYEVDDVHGVPIAINSSQARLFYPEGDVDKVFFTARAAHRYAVYTEQLSSGVDTVLFATMGALMVSNDNRAPGDPSSYLELWNDTPSDLQATITVTNRGQYGLDKRYVLWVRDLGAEGLDEFEPDLTILRPIELDVVQRRNFFPAGDIDRAVLRVTAGERYAVLTCANADLPPLPIASTDPFVPFDLRCAPLGPGVDTVLVVSGPIRRCIPEGCQSVNVPQGEFATYTNSRVEFDAVQDGQVTIMIYNRGTFGVHQVYYLRAHRIDPVPTPTPTPSRTPTLTPSVTPTPSITPTPSPTPSMAPYPSPGAGLSPGGGDTLAHRSPSWIMSAHYSAPRPLLAPLRQAAETSPAPGAEAETIRFTLLLRMRPLSP